MLSFKKVYRDELLQLALILSLLRANQDTLYDYDNLYNNVNNFDFNNGTSWRSLSPSILRSHFINPKSLDSVLLNYERDIFADLNSLGRYNRISFRHPNVTTYLLNIERSATTPSTTTTTTTTNPGNNQENQQNQTENNVNNSEQTNGPIDVGIELTQEDMDLIEVLWKQDVDLGFSLETANAKPQNEKEPPTSPSSTTDDGKNVTNGSTSKLLEEQHADDENEDDIKKDKEKEEKIIKTENGENNDDPWAGLEYTVDTETGEYVIKEEPVNEGLFGENYDYTYDNLTFGDLSLPIPEFLLDEALRELNDDSSQDTLNIKDLETLSLENTTDSNTNNSGEKSDNNNTASSKTTENTSTSDKTGSEVDGNNQKENTEEDLDIFDSMIQTPQFHHPHHRAFQSRMPFVRSVSMDQRWQDLASLLSLPSSGDGSGIHHPFSHHHAIHNYSHPHAHSMGYSADTARGVLLHNATLTPPMGDLNSSVPYSNIGGTNLGNAVATSMNLTNSSEPMGEPNTGGHYKLEPSHEMMYYQNGTEMNQTDGFLSSILNDEDLQLMDMAMNEGMYTMRMLDSNNTISNLSMSGASGTTMSRTDVERMDTSSDSAVSSMGSERVPSLSDGEWCDAGSDSGHTAGEHYVNDYQSKFRPYDYSYTSRQLNDTTRIPPVAQKKHQMYGKRYFQEQGTSSSATAAAAVAAHQPVKYEYRDNNTTQFPSTNQSEAGAIGPKPPELKYSCSIEFNRQTNHLSRTSVDHVQHNHTYHLPAENSGVMQRPVCRDKSKQRKADEEHLTRDEKRARALNVPISVDDIINLPMDEFNERLSKYDLSEAQLSLIRDIRRRGKNKVAAQNCRKRKLDQILSLADEVKEMRDRKMQLMHDHEYVLSECKRMKEKYQQLYRHVFQNLRDPEGNPYSPYQYSLQTSADGSILMVPHSNSTLTNPERKEPPQSHKE